MERLTSKDEQGRTKIIHKNCAGYNEICEAYVKVVERLAELEDKLESGQLLELPLPKQDVVFHIVKRMRINTRTKPKWFYSKRIVSWKGFVSIILDKGNDGLWFSTSQEAEARLKELNEALSVVF